MKRRRVGIATLLLVGLLSGAYLRRERAVRAAPPRELSSYELSSYLFSSYQFSSWAPDAAAIRKALGKRDAASCSAENIEDARHTQFVALFKSRFRHHEPMLAVSVRFVDTRCLKLMCPARMKPWDMDRLTMSAWHETRDAFGHPYDIDIYETFIGTPPIKIGELRPTPGNPRVACIRYRYPDLSRL